MDISSCLRAFKSFGDGENFHISNFAMRLIEQYYVYPPMPPMTV